VQLESSDHFRAVNGLLQQHACFDCGLSGISTHIMAMPSQCCCPQSHMPCQHALLLPPTMHTGTLPDAWGNLHTLQRLDLSYTSWQPQPPPNSWPVSWGNMSSLHYLDLSGSNYTTVIAGGPA